MVYMPTFGVYGWLMLPYIAYHSIHGSYGYHFQLCAHSTRSDRALRSSTQAPWGSAATCGKGAMVTSLGLTWMVVVKFIAKCLLKVAFCFTFFSCDDYLQSCHVILLMNGEGSRGNVQEDIRSFKLFSNGSIAVWSPHGPQYCHIEIYYI